jgi:hypothetical protein
MVKALSLGMIKRPRQSAERSLSRFRPIGHARQPGPFAASHHKSVNLWPQRPRYPVKQRDSVNQSLCLVRTKAARFPTGEDRAQ